MNLLHVNIKIKYFILIVLSTVFISNGYSVKYYISNSGSDDNAGTSQSSAWKTINKLNSMMTSINPGDEIFFECGSVFTGGIIIPANISGVKGNTIVFSSYGNGPKPVICGSIPVTGWTQYSGHIWSASVNVDTITQLLKKVQTGSYFLNFSQFANGMYLLKIGAVNKKIVVKH